MYDKNNNKRFSVLLLIHPYNTVLKIFLKYFLKNLCIFIKNIFCFCG